MSIKERKYPHEKKELENNPLALFLEECIQSGLQFEGTERGALLDKAIDFCLDKRVI